MAVNVFMLEIHLKQPAFLNDTSNSRYIYQNKLDKEYIQHDMGYGDFNPQFDRHCGFQKNVWSLERE